MGRYHDREIEADLAFVVGHQLSAGTVDLPGIELGDELDAAFLEHPPQAVARHGLGERAVERRDEGDLHPVAHLLLAEVPVGQEAELEGSDWALDRHLDDVHDEATALEEFEPLRERRAPSRS